MVSLHENKKLLFIGDSITEDGRFQDPNMLGQGYVRIIHDYFRAKNPDDHQDIRNMGISGNRITDIAERWQTDVLAQQADVVTISIGINDVWRQLDQPEMQQVYPEQFATIYEKLLASLQTQSDRKVVLMEPTIIGENENTAGNRLLQDYVSIVRELCISHHATIVPLHHIFLSHLKSKPDVSLTTDGVHMNAQGRQLMAAAWLEAMHR